MRQVNIHEAKTNLSRLVEEAAAGDSFVIAKAGKPMVKVTRVDAPGATKQRRLGFLKGKIKIPENFDRLAEDEILALFEGRKK